MFLELNQSAPTVIATLSIQIHRHRSFPQAPAIPCLLSHHNKRAGVCDFVVFWAASPPSFPIPIAPPRPAMSALSLNFERSILIGAAILFLSVFLYFAPGYPLSKQRAWILTAVGSSTMSLASLPFVYDFLKSGTLAALVRRPWLSDSACRFFQSYLAS